MLVECLNCEALVDGIREGSYDSGGYEYGPTDRHSLLRCPRCRGPFLGKEANLKKSLETLRDSQVIDGRLFEWADALRLFGNEAAHGVAVTISKQDAEDTIAFTNALLEYVFTFRDRFEEFRQRRNQKTT
jgi:hypothetical protein